VAESVLHDLVECSGTRGDVVVHDQGSHTAALDRDRAVALSFAATSCLTPLSGNVTITLPMIT
jgi:hypothetical protein